jgi:hypothetical protein
MLRPLPLDPKLLAVEIDVLQLEPEKLAKARPV